MSKVTIPNHLIAFLFTSKEPTKEEAHLAGLIQEVYRRLPAYDRKILRELVLQVDVTDEFERRDVLGSTGLVDPSSVYDGNIGNSARNENNIVTLKRTIMNKSDASCMFVIAHEFAHNILRHFQLGMVLACLEELPNLNPYTDSDYEQIEKLKEDEADLQVWVWGFDEEMRTFMEEYPEVWRPCWFIDIHSIENGMEL